MYNLSDTVERKFIESFDVSDWEIETDTGWETISHSHKTIKYQEYILRTDNNKEIICADTHIIFDENMNEIFVKDCIPLKTKIQTSDGIALVTEVIVTNEYSNMYDLSIDSLNHRYYGGDILSHNSTTTCGFILWYIIFHPEKTVALLANKGETAREILGRVQLAYQHLPKWLQHGVKEWNKGSMVLENNSRVIAAATSTDAIRGYSINLLFIDEAAHIDNWEEFFTSVYPTISSGKESKIILVSTPFGLNHFYSLWMNAQRGTNKYNPIKVMWNDVPGRDDNWKDTTLAAMNFDTEKFEQEHCCEFLGSSGTLIAGWKLKELVHQTPLVEKEGLYQYEKPEKDHIYCCTVDVSRGKGLDYSAFNIIDVTSMPYKQVCVYRNNQVTPVDYAEIVKRTAVSYNRAFILVEINDIGEQVAFTLHTEFEYDNVLFTESAGRHGKKVSSGFGNSSSIDKGIRTTKPVKNTGCSLLKLLIEQNQLVINDFNTISELSTFSKKNNSYEAEEGRHDDLVMSLVIFAWLSDQQYFKENTNINTLSQLRDKSNDEIDADMSAFGFIDNGMLIEDLIEPEREYGWMFPAENEKI